MRAARLFAVLLTLAPVKGWTQDCESDVSEPGLGALSILPSFRALPARVPWDVQDATLEAMLSRVMGMDDARRIDPRLPRAVIQIDLDYTAFVPRANARAALKAVGMRFGIPELADPSSLTRLPTYRKAAWDRFVENTGLASAHPHVDWEAAYTEFEDVSYHLIPQGAEELTPGLARFYHHVVARGGVVVFNTGRPERTRPLVLGVLARGGIVDPPLVMKSEERSPLPAEEAKAAVQPMIRERWGETIAVIDDFEADREAIAAAAGPNVMKIPIALRGFANELSWSAFDAIPWRLESFETSR